MLQPHTVIRMVLVVGLFAHIADGGEVDATKPIGTRVEETGVNGTTALQKLEGAPSKPAFRSDVTQKKAPQSTPDRSDRTERTFHTGNESKSLGITKSDSLSIRRKLVAAILIIGGGLFAVHQLLRRRTQSHDGSEDVELISTLTFAPRCCLSLVRACGQTLLVARDASGIKNVILLEQFEPFIQQELATDDPNIEFLARHGDLLAETRRSR